MNIPNIKTKLAAVLAGALLCVAQAGITAFAAGSDETNANGMILTLTKELEKDAQTVAPNTSFRFILTPDTEADGSTDTASQKVKNGVEGAVKLESDTIAFTPSLSDAGVTSLKGTTKVIAYPDQFPTMGIYRYVLSEEDGDYEGVAYDDQTIYLDVYVQHSNPADAESDMMVAGMVAFVNDGNYAGGKKKLDALTFTNKMKSIAVNDTERIHTLTLTNQVSGNQGDLTKKFSYSILITGNDDGKAGGDGKEKYLLIDADKKNQMIASGTPAIVSLSHNQQLTVTGLSKNDTFRITQTAEDGYVTEIYRSGVNEKIGADGDTDVQAMMTKGSSGDIFSDVDITYTNTKNISTPTGVAFTYGPYLLMLLFACILIGLTVSRKHRGRF